MTGGGRLTGCGRLLISCAKKRLKSLDWPTARKYYLAIITSLSSSTFADGKIDPLPIQEALGLVSDGCVAVQLAKVSDGVRSNGAS